MVLGLLTLIYNLCKKQSKRHGRTPHHPSRFRKSLGNIYRACCLLLHSCFNVIIPYPQTMKNSPGKTLFDPGKDGFTTSQVNPIDKLKIPDLSCVRLILFIIKVVYITKSLGTFLPIPDKIQEYFALIVVRSMFTFSQINQ